MKTQQDVLMQDPEFRRLFAIESLAGSASNIIAELMEQQGVNKAELAKRLKKSRSWITQLLSGKANMTIRTLAEVAHALGGEVEITGRVVDVHTRKKAPQTATKSQHYIFEDNGGPLSSEPEYAA